MRLGLYGGTFDPVHYGHLVLAEQCREQCDLDQVWLIPSHQSPHKTGATTSPGRARLEMLRLATAGAPDFVVSDLEIRRGGVSFTVDTLQQLHDEDPSRELFFLIGADSLYDLPTWREPQRIAELATIVAVNRGDRPLPDAANLHATLGQSLAQRVKLVTMPGIDLSGSNIRRRVHAGRSIRFLTPRAVEMYISQHGLYRDPSKAASSQPAADESGDTGGE